jgi:hypothetical protein
MECYFTGLFGGKYRVMSVYFDVALGELVVSGKLVEKVSPCDPEKCDACISLVKITASFKSIDALESQASQVLDKVES